MVEPTVPLNVVLSAIAVSTGVPYAELSDKYFSWRSQGVDTQECLTRLFDQYF